MCETRRFNLLISETVSMCKSLTVRNDLARLRNEFEKELKVRFLKVVPAYATVHYATLTT